jgi:DNA-binding CsgD family transcriptional regulator
MDRLLAPRADALRGALRMAGPPFVDPFAVAVATLDLLAIAAEDAPVLVVVDDAPWVDAASLEALRFAARRLNADRVGFLFAARDELAAPFAGVDSLPVRGLDTAEAVGLVNAFARSRVAPSVARRLAEAGRGHPLWLREAARDLSPEQMSGAAPLTDRFSVRTQFERLARSLPGAVRQALAVLGADEQAPAAVMQRALVDLGLDAKAVQPSIDCGLVHEDAGRPRFSHPLALAAALAVADPAQRRLAHEALARAWDDAGESERATWHRAESGDGPDAHVSSALAAVARAARARGAPDAAAAAWRRALETAPDAEQALPLRLERARDLAQAGQGSEALVELDEIFQRGRAADLRADAEILHGQILISQARLTEAARVLEPGAARIRDSDPARAAVMLAGAAFAKASQAELTAGVATAEAAVALSRPLGGPAAAIAEATLGWILILAGEGARGYPLMLQHAERGEPPGRALDGVQAPARLGLFALWMEDYDTARQELERAVVLARDRGLISDLPLALGGLSELEFRVGNWIAAHAHAQDAFRLAHEADQFLHFGHTGLLNIAAATGDAEGTRRYADIIVRVAARSGSRMLEMYAPAGLGLLALGLDDPETAIAHLSRTREITRRGGADEPNVLRWMPDLIESQIRAGEEDQARDTLREFEGQAQRTGGSWAAAAAARYRGLLAPPETVDAIFAEADRLAAAQPSPFESARTALCWGERLRRDGHRVEARRHLHRALKQFEGLGATPWAAKAERELRSSGGRARRGARARSGELTPQEMQIATMVAEGRTNRNIADSLFLSPKTIEFHLGHVYRKLHVSNRTELTRALLIGSTA